MPTIEQIRYISKLARLYGMNLPVEPVCRGHHSPATMVAQIVFDRPPMVLWTGPRGGGKAQPLSSLVQTPLGPVRMGDIRVGDEVCTPEGGVTTVAEVHPQGEKPVYRIDFRDGDSAECCPDHLWEVSSKQRAWRRPKVVTTEYLLANYLSPSRSDCNFSIRLPKPLEFRPVGPPPMIPPYTLGVLIGDGNMGRQHLRFTSADPEIVEAVSASLTGDISLTPGKHYAYGISTPPGRKNPYLDELRRLGLGGKYSYEKHIPLRYLHGTIADRWDLIRGLMDTDGYVDDRGHVSYCTTSPDLARDFKFLAESLGGICVTKTKETGFKLAYNLYLKFDDPSQLFRLTRKRERGLPRTKYPAKRIITDIQNVGVRECQCITLADPAGLYLTNNCIVTHNSAGASLTAYLQGGWYPEFEARILGGSLAQSDQIYRALDIFRKARPDADLIREMLQTRAVFHSGALIETLTASPKSVHGPHVPSLYLDEVDEIDDEIRQHSVGMLMRKGRLKASLVLSSTWHKVAGPMSDLIREGKEEGKFPVGTFCMFDVLERCPEERSGPNLEKCPDCPIVRWCHAGIDEHPSRLPKAKRSSGHYDIDAFIQKTAAVGNRVFESDYLCLRPRAPGQWFKDFSEDRHVTAAAEFNPAFPVHVAIDPGVHTGAVLFQFRRARDGSGRVNVFGDYYQENIEGDQSGGAEAQGRNIAALTRELTGRGTHDGLVSMDPAHRQRNAGGIVVLGEYQRAGCVGRGREIRPWPTIGPGRPKTDTLQLVEAMLLCADGTVSLTIHPRCKNLIRALPAYTRKKTTSGQWLDEPASPQHPQEEAIDALAGGLCLEMPEGRTPPPILHQVPARLYT